MLGESGNVGIFGTATRTRVLVTIHAMGETYPTQIARVLDISLNQAQLAIASLESAGIVVCEVVGRQRMVFLNPRCALEPELSALLLKMVALDGPLQRELGKLRRRPRRTGKEI